MNEAIENVIDYITSNASIIFWINNGFEISIFLL